MSDLLIQKKREEQTFLREQTQKWTTENQLFENDKTDTQVYDHRHYSFLERQENKINGCYGAGTEIKKEAEPAAEVGDWEVVQQERELSKAEKKVAEQEAKLFKKQSMLAELRNNNPDGALNAKDAKKLAKAEEKYFQEKLSLIDLQAEADLEKAKTEKDKLEISVNKCQAIVDAWTDYTKTLNIGTSKRKSAIKQKEKAQLDLYWAQYKLKLENTKPEEQKKANSKYRRKVIEAYLKKGISKSDENCEEDHIIKTEINGKPVELVNMGRAFLGGTKPTYYYKDMKSGKQYLYKKAENCCGISKPEGAIVTEIGGKLQHIVDPEHEIPAVGIKNAKGEYIGSIQEIMDVTNKPTIDLDAWQTEYEAKRNPDPEIIKKPEIQKQLLIFHCVDWLLCNFDTKAEHLLQKKDGSFVSIDKEGGMNKILKDDAQSMSCTYKPHNHEPIYNIFFRYYRDNKIDLDPGALKALDEKIHAVEAYSEEEYMKMFEPYIKQRNKNPKKMRENILRRKQNLRAEYNKFLDSLRKGTVLPNNIRSV